MKKIIFIVSILVFTFNLLEAKKNRVGYQYEYLDTIKFDSPFILQNGDTCSIFVLNDSICMVCNSLDTVRIDGGGGGFSGNESDPIYAGDSIYIIFFSDTLLTIATKYDLDIMQANIDNITVPEGYNRDSVADYINDSSVVLMSDTVIKIATRYDTDTTLTNAKNYANQITGDTTEVDPVFSQSVAGGITAEDTASWNAGGAISDTVNGDTIFVLISDTLLDGRYYTQRQVDSIIATISTAAMTPDDINDSLQTLGSGYQDYVGNDTITLLYNYNNYDTISLDNDTLVINGLNAQKDCYFTFNINYNAISDTLYIIQYQSYVDTIILPNGVSYLVIPEDQTCAYMGRKRNNAYIKILSDECYDYVPADATPAYLVSAEIGNVSDSTLVATFNETLDQSSVPAETAFTVMEGTGEMGIYSVDILDNILTLVLDSTIDADSTVLFSYTKPGSNMLKNLAGLETDSWADSSVTTDFNPANLNPQHYYPTNYTMTGSSYENPDTSFRDIFDGTDFDLYWSGSLADGRPSAVRVLFGNYDGSGDSCFYIDNATSGALQARMGDSPIITSTAQDNYLVNGATGKFVLNVRGISGVLYMYISYNGVDITQITLDVTNISSFIGVKKYMDFYMGVLNNNGTPQYYITGTQNEFILFNSAVATAQRIKLFKYLYDN